MVRLKPHPMLPVRATCQVVLNGRWAPKLLAGCALQDRESWSNKLLAFWERYRSVDGSHPVFRDHANTLATCIPALLHGDEGVGHRRRPVLQLSWGPMLAIGNGSWDRLFLFSTCPSKLYSKYNQGNAAGNPVLDRLLEEMARSMRTAYFVGVPTSVAQFYIVCLGFSGDHIFQSKAFRCLRHHTRNDLCPHCLANLSDIPFEDVSMRALWTRTVFTTLPWDTPPPLRFIPGADKAEFIQFDLMHVLPHGCGRTFIASVICMMVGPLNFFLPPGRKRGVELRLEEAYSSFRSFCQANKFHPRDMQEFTKENLAWDSTSCFPDCGCKAMDCVMLFQWCIDLFTSMPLEMTEPISLAYAACCGFDDFNRLCYTSQNRIFWTRDEARKGYKFLRAFLKGYRALAWYWYERNWTLFNMTPKMHYACHWLWSLHEFLFNSDKTWFLNPGAFATPMMEGFVGYTSRIARTTHPSGVAVGTINKYLVEVRRAWMQGDDASGACEQCL